MIKNIDFSIKSSEAITFSWCPPGAFSYTTRGSSLFAKNGHENVDIVFSKGFWMSNTSVTIGQWNRVLGERSRFKAISNPVLPVYGIDYREATSFLLALNEIMKPAYPDVTFAFPNYLQYHYACEAREIADNQLFWSDEKDFSQYAWYRSNAGNKVQEVATKLPNPWGIYDLYGNILEICVDVACDTNSTKLIDPVSIRSDEHLTVSGGCFDSYFADCQVSKKSSMDAENTYIEPLGVRLVC